MFTPNRPLICQKDKLRYINKISPGMTKQQKTFGWLSGNLKTFYLFYFLDIFFTEQTLIKYLNNDQLAKQLNESEACSSLGSLYTSPGWLLTRCISLVAVKSKFCLHEPGLPPLTTIWGELMLTRVRSFVLRYVKWKASLHYLFSSHLRSFHSCTGNVEGSLILLAI